MSSNKEYYDKWRRSNWDARKEYMRRKVRCDCGMDITRGSMYLHIRSNVHNNLLGTQPPDAKDHAMKKRVDCECGCNVTKGSLRGHRLSSKHIDLLALKSLSKPIETEEPEPKKRRSDKSSSKRKVNKKNLV